MSMPSDAGFTAFIGLDWADAKHDFCLQPGDSGAREFGTFAHQAEAIEAWAHGIHQRFGGRIAIALELAKGPVVYALQKYDFLVLFPINRPCSPSIAKHSSRVGPRMIRPMRSLRWI